MKYKVIDNFLDEEYFDSLVTLFTDKDNRGNQIMPWFLNSCITFDKTHKKYTAEETKLFYMTHLFYEENKPYSDHYNSLIPLLAKLEARCLIRVKGNFYPNTETLQEHGMHTDYPFPHSSAILSLNTCDGYTKLKDGTKINSIANRILLFDASEEHCSTTATNVFARINININYIQVQEQAYDLLISRIRS